MGNLDKAGLKKNSAHTDPRWNKKQEKRKGKQPKMKKVK